MMLRTIFAVLALVSMTGCAAEAASEDGTEQTPAAAEGEKPAATEDSAPAQPGAPRTVEWHMVHTAPAVCSEQGAGAGGC